MNYNNGMSDGGNNLRHTEPNILADAVKTSSYLGRKKYSFRVKGKTIIMKTAGKKYAIESKDYMQGRELTEALEEAFFGGNCGFGCTIDAYREKLSKASYSPLVKYYLSRMDRAGVPVDFTIIDAIYNCKPVGHDEDIPDIEREHMVRSYIFGLAQSVYEYTINQNIPPIEERDPSTIYTTAEDVEEFHMIPKMNSVFVSYNMDDIFKNGEVRDSSIYRGVANYAKTMWWQDVKRLLWRIAFGLEAGQAKYIARVLEKDMNNSKDAFEGHDLDE